MINVYNWSYEIDRNLVRIEFDLNLEKRIRICIKEFGGQLMPVKTNQNETIVKFKTNKVANDFIVSLYGKYPNSFHLNNEWELSRNSEFIVSFTSMHSGTVLVNELSELINSLFYDCKTISSLISTETSNLLMILKPKSFLRISVNLEHNQIFLN